MNLKKHFQVSIRPNSPADKARNAIAKVSPKQALRKAFLAKVIRDLSDQASDE